MTESHDILPAEIAGTEITRFNALKHGVLSRYTVLPGENADEYAVLMASLVAEHRPNGPTEEHLVEELAGRSRPHPTLTACASLSTGTCDPGTPSGAWSWKTGP